MEPAPEYNKIDAIIESFSSEKSALIGILQEVENLYGYLPPWALKHVSKKLDVPLIQVCGVASFYKAFHLTPRGKHLVRVCLGTACHVRGGPGVAEELERELDVKMGGTTKDLNYTLERVNCLGCCALGPIVTIDDKYHGHMSAKKIRSVLKQPE